MTLRARAKTGVLLLIRNDADDPAAGLRCIAGSIRSTKRCTNMQPLSVARNPSRLDADEASKLDAMTDLVDRTDKSVRPTIGGLRVAKRGSNPISCWGSG